MFNNRNLIIGSIVFVVVVLTAILWPSSDDTQSVQELAKKVEQRQAAKQQSQAQEPVRSQATSSSNSSANQLFQSAKNLENDGEWLEAKKQYQMIYNDHPSYEGIEEVQHRLENINMQIIFSNTPTQYAKMHEVVRGDTLGELAKQYGTTIDLIKQNNALESDMIRIGQTLRIWSEPFKIYVDKSQNKLTLKTGDEVVKVYNVSTGTNSSTPIGEFNITTKLRDPVWFNKGVVVPPESPSNVLGTRWLGFDIPGYGIHGTIEPDRIGEQVTAGCVRMRNEEVEELYSIIPLGTKVSVAN